MALPTPPAPRAAGKDRRQATPERGLALRAGLPVAGLGPWIGEGADGRGGNASADGYSRSVSVACLGSWGRAENHLILGGIQRLRVPGLGVYRDRDLTDRQSALGRNRLSGNILARWAFLPIAAKRLKNRVLEASRGSSAGWLSVTLAARWAQRA
jgi:hypothetical protein